MKLLSLFKPEYIYRPGQIARRLRYGGLSAPARAGEFAVADLPWGLPLRVRRGETIGHSILSLGVFELLVTESLWRLIDPGETVADVGANIGYMSSVMARRVGPSGAVLAFEAHPGVHADLLHNVGLWSQSAMSSQLGRVDARHLAVSDQTGDCTLNVPAAFETNRGLATLESGADGEREARAGAAPAMTTITVRRTTLDEAFPASEAKRVGLVKMDVEGHELAILRGASALIAGRRVRDWIFEENRPYPSEVTRFFVDHGYTLLRLHKTFSRPGLIDPKAPAADAHSASEAPESPNFMATLEPGRARERFRPGGWRALRPPKPQL